MSYHALTLGPSAGPSAREPLSQRVWVRYPESSQPLSSEEEDAALVETESGCGAEVLNATSAGIDLLLRRRLRPGTPLVLEALMDEAPWYTMPVIVRMMTRGSYGWIAHCLFQAAPRGNPPAEDRRLQPRYICTARPYVRLLAKPSFRSYQAFVYDISLGGIGLILDQSFSAGTTLAVQVRRTVVALSGILTVQVCHSTVEQGSAYRVGGRFCRPLSDEELAAFL